MEPILHKLLGYSIYIRWYICYIYHQCMRHILDHPQHTIPWRSSDILTSILCIFHWLLLRNLLPHKHLFFLGMGSYIGDIHRSCTWHILQCNTWGLMLSWMGRRMIYICRIGKHNLAFCRRNLQFQSKHSCLMSRHYILNHLLWPYMSGRLGYSSRRGLTKDGSLAYMICIFWFGSCNRCKNLTHIFLLIIGRVWSMISILVLLLFNTLESHRLLHWSWMAPHT